MRRLRFNGSSSGNNGCPTLYEDLDSGEFVIQGVLTTDPGELVQLRHLAPDEAAVVVPRHLLANFAPKEAIPTRETISFEAFDGMFTTLEHSAWRLETRRRYASDEETNTYAQFSRGETVRWDLNDLWCVNRREQTAAGKRFERVRIVDEPATSGQLYLLDNARRNAAVGEDIRILTRSRAAELKLPEEDFWVFDSRVVAMLLFDDDDQMTGVELITNPAEVLVYSQAREAAWHHAVPYDRFEPRVAHAE